MARSNIKCWWCMNPLEQVAGKLIFASVQLFGMPTGTMVKVHKSCKENCEQSMKKLTADIDHFRDNQ